MKCTETDAPPCLFRLTFSRLLSASWRSLRMDTLTRTWNGKHRKFHSWLMFQRRSIVPRSDSFGFIHGQKIKAVPFNLKAVGNAEHCFAIMDCSAVICSLPPPITLSAALSHSSWWMEQRFVECNSNFQPSQCLCAPCQKLRQWEFHSLEVEKCLCIKTTATLASLHWGSI